MSDDPPQKSVWRLDVGSEAETIELAQEFSTLVRSGDAVMLSGDLGAGKTTFARALIRALVEDPALEAPSPTFTLMQIYEGAGKRVVHADFYRLENAAELADLGWEEATDDSIVLVEWAERARDALSPDRLEV
ncbi:MAG: tRNA (adenosine(37)-N6)-threonylcarbamoyltransferase complex ATPase subunit type 1 TsaE, partial [Methylocystis sp.]